MLKILTSVLSDASIRWLTFCSGSKVGEDALGNVYYTAKAKRGQKRERRWVLYKGAADASSVPAEWHGWLHHQSDEVPSNDNPLRRPWQLPPQKNLTGTSAAYVPPGHLARGGHRDKATGDYQAWMPPQ